MSRHHPPHIFLDNTCYAVTSATYNHEPLLADPAAKTIVRGMLESLVRDFEIRLHAWVILDNHYHLLLRTNRGKDMSTFFARLHGASSRGINSLEQRPERQVWHNFWDTCIRTERDFWMRFNYIHHNPVKHGYAQRMEDWVFSSYGYYLRAKGSEWLADCWMSYPVIDFSEADSHDRR